ncbi:MAG: calcium-binding protein [Cyanobacteria bacterium J06621_11]
MANIGETTALIPQAGASYAPEHLQDGGSGDTDFPYGDFKVLASVGEKDPNNGHVLTGYPDGQAAWLADEDTVRVAYQSESYGTLSSETYGWEMESGATFSGSHVHTIDYDRASFANFLGSEEASIEMFEAADHLFNQVYNVFGELVTGKNDDASDLGAKWGNQTLADGTLVEFDSGSNPLEGLDEDQRLTLADWYFHSFCGAYLEYANKYGDGIGFEDDVWLMAEEWNIGSLFEEAALAAGFTEEESRLGVGRDFFTTTMGLASMVVDIDNQTAYTAPALGQSGYEKLMPINSGHEDYVVIVTAGYNLEVEPAPLTVYVGKKGVDANGDALTEDANGRDSFLGRNGLLYGQLYGMAATDETYAALGIEEVDADIKMLDEYATNADAPDNFSARYIPTSYRWDGFDTPEAAADTEVFLWEKDGDTLEDGTVEANEQPNGGYTYFNGDSKTEHPAADPDITKHRFVQTLTVPSAHVGVEFTDIVNELENNDADGNGLPDYLSADVTRILAGVDGALTLDVGDKGAAPIGPNNPDGTRTHATHLEIDEARAHQPDGLQWIKTSDGDYLIVDEDSGNDYGERKYILPIDSETMQLKEDGKGYLLAVAGGALNPRAIGEVAAIPDTFSSATSSEFSGTWTVTHLVETKADGSFYTKEELTGTTIQDIIGSKTLAEQTLLGVVQHRGESGGIVNGEEEGRDADQGGQIFLFNVNGNVANGGQPVEILGTSRKDEITGTDANEIILGGDTRDILNGGGGNDQVFGENGRDVIYGGEGDDLMHGGLGKNKAFGEAGSDTFAIALGGDTRVMDFTVGEDKIGLTEGITFGQLSIEKRGKNALISVGDEVALRVMNTAVDALTESMFVAV